MIRRWIATLAFAGLVGTGPVHAGWVAPFISEIHYDNAGVDRDEFVAVAGPAGWDLNGWQLAFYNGANGGIYRSLAIDGVLPGDPGRLGEGYWAVTGIQNGPDAVALLSPQDMVVDFVAYEAAVSAFEGPAAGLQARLLPVAEDNTTPAGRSLQRQGTPETWSWSLAEMTPGRVNGGLEEVDSGTIPEPAGAVVLWIAGGIAWSLLTGGRRWSPRIGRRVA